MSRALALCFTLCLLPGCDLLGDGTAIVATGVVLDDSTNQPASGVSVSLARRGGLFVPYSAVSSTRTDEQGRFRLEYDPGDSRNQYDIRVNSNPYDETYSSAEYSVEPGERSDETTALYQHVTLTVVAETETPLRDGDSVFLWLPGTGARASQRTTTRARGNRFNEVRLLVNRGGATRELVDSVYCPVGEATRHVITF